MIGWFLKYIKDRIFLLAGFFISSFLIILFFNLSGSEIELAYPIIVILFVFILFTSIDLFRYLSFNRNLGESIDNVNYDLEPQSEEQKNVSHVIYEIHQRYMEKFYELNNSIEEKEKFISHWIHNLKTPVSVIDLIIQKCEAKEVQLEEGLQNIKQENNRIFHTVEQVLNIYRLEDFSRDYIPEATNLVDTLNKVINSKKNQFIYNHVYPKLHVPDDKVLVLSDEKWNLIMLDQVISNAIKYSKEGEESKDIDIKIELQNGRTILSIIDKGVGIPPYDLNKVFEPFFTGENGRKYRDSTGIGLYMCSMIAEKLGHKIKIDSEIGKGTRVKITYLSRM